MSAALITRVAVALLQGAVLLSRSWSVGPYHLTTDPPDSLRFACLDLQGVPSCASEEYREVVLVVGLYVDSEDRYAEDWTAFGAARMFMALAGPTAAEAALVARAQLAA
jgi:hypothetical protein